MVEDQTHCSVGKSELTAKLYQDRLEVVVADHVVALIGIPTHYVVLFSATAELLREMDATLQMICSGIADYSREF
jgi:hypothetical protein